MAKWWGTAAAAAAKIEDLKGPDESRPRPEHAPAHAPRPTPHENNVYHNFWKNIMWRFLFCIHRLNLTTANTVYFFSETVNSRLTLEQGPYSYMKLWEDVFQTIPNILFFDSRFFVSAIFLIERIVYRNFW